MRAVAFKLGIAAALVMAQVAWCAPPASQPASGWTTWRGGPAADGQSAFVPAQLPGKAHFLWEVPMQSPGLGGVAATTSRVIVSDKAGDDDLWLCFDANTGQRVWQVRYAAPAKMDYSGIPRATPAIVDDLVYLRGAAGHLYCVRLADGNTVWSCNILERFGGELPTWGFCATPLVIQNRLILNTSSPKAAMVALDRHTGRTVWTTSGGPPSYGNFILAAFGGRLQIVGHDKNSAGGWDPDTGQRLWTLVPPLGDEFNVPTPVQVGDRLLLATERNGARLYDFAPTGVIIPTPAAVNKKLLPDVSSPVLADGLIWGNCHSGLYCLDPANGLQVVYHNGDEAFREVASFISGPRYVLVSLKNGSIALLPSRPDSATVPTFMQVFTATADSDPQVWSHPALLPHRLYLRNESRLVCVEFP